MTLPMYVKWISYVLDLSLEGAVRRTPCMQMDYGLLLVDAINALNSLNRLLDKTEFLHSMVGSYLCGYATLD